MRKFTHTLNFRVVQHSDSSAYKFSKVVVFLYKIRNLVI